MNETFARHVIETTPLIDGFCRPLLGREQQEQQQQSAPLSLLFPGTSSTLVRSRAVGQLAKLLGCPPTPADVDAALSTRREEEDAATYDAWTQRCLGGIRALVQSPPADSRDAAPAAPAAPADTAKSPPSKRIAQVEQLLESFFEDSDGQPTDAPWDDFKWVIDRAIEDVVELADVCGLDSISCLHGGLAVDAETIASAAQEAYAQLMTLERERDASQPAPAFRLQHPSINRYVLHRLAAHVRDATSLETRKPIRLHAGHGHTDGHSLLPHASSSPADLQHFVASYPSVPFVLMGTGYPKVREAAYLASANANVYVDLGLVLPLLDRQGQEQVLRGALEVCPWTKILAGSGGGRVPESYYLGQLQLREALSVVLCGLARSGDMSWDDVADAARSILHANANKLYHLDLPGPFVPNGEGGPAVQDATVLAAHPVPAEEQLRMLQNEMIGRRSDGSPAEYVTIAFIDYVGLQRQKSVHVSHIWSSLQAGSPLSVGVVECIFGLLPNDHAIPGLPPTGEYRVHPDFSWIKRAPDGDVTMHGEFRNPDDSHVDMCPRTIVRKVLDVAKKHGLEFRVGFEIELVIMQRDDQGNGYRALGNSSGHAWSSARAMRYPVMALLRKAVAHLADNGIVVEQLHAESSPGQFELVLAHAPPLEAIDNLVFARQVVADMVAEGGYAMTLHPKPFPDMCGTAAHAHMSICSPGGDDPAVYEPFYAGILNRLPAVSALTLPSPVSWSRVVDGAWAGGTNVSWGTQNRETPLRKLKGSHWEIKCIDGIANPFLAIASLLAAGTLGVANKEPIQPYQDMRVDPSVLSSEELANHGITQKLPGSTWAAITALTGQKDLCAAMGDAFVDRYVATKLHETAEWEKMSAYDQHKWVLDRF